MNPVGQTVNLPAGIASGIAPGGSEYKTGAGPTKVTEARQINGQTFYNIDQTGIGGGTGWVNSSALGGSTPAAPTPAPASAPTSQPSSPSTPALPQAPTFDLVAATNAAYNTPEIAAANKAITDRQTALTKAQAEINDNPFYSEATRVGKSQQLTQQANADIGVQQNILAGLKADAAIKLNAATGQYNINRQAYQDTLSQFNMILNAGGLTNASPADLANMAVSTGISLSELQSIQKTQQDKNLTTSLVTNNDGTISVINAKTGEVIHQTQPGVGPVKIPKAGGAGAGGYTKKQMTAALNELAKADTANYGTADHQLSNSEGQGAYTKILALAGGDQTVAQTLFNDAMTQGGYSKWNPTPAKAATTDNGGLIGELGNWWNSLFKK